jgi:antitoxin component YwqK of YwqJK toxin-antitoxin module
MEKGETKPKIEYYNNGTIYSIRYYKKGQYHREGNLPAGIYYYESGIVSCEQYYRNGELNRDGDLPSIVYYHQDGNISYEEYCLNGKPHRENGLPAVINYLLNGKTRSKGYYINGLEIDKEELEEFEKFKILYKDDLSMLVLNSKHENPMIQHYCQKELITLKSLVD